MNTRAILLSLALGAACTLGAAEPVALSVAVFDFESKDESVRDLGTKISALLNANLSAEPKLVLVERAELDKVLGEQELGLSGTVSPASAAKIGQLTGAQVLVTGRVFKVEKETMLVAKVIGTETGRVYGETVKGGAAIPVTDLSAQLATKIAETLGKKGDTLIAQVIPRERRIAELKKAVGNGPLPTVSVKLPERHFGGPVVDPAAETELGLMLQECGFKLIGEKSGEKPDIEIVGEAFSAFGVRRGNLVSCRARVEVQARRADGSIAAVDRQTGVAVDIAEQTAAKTALQEAALDIAERLLPKLVAKR